jgi:hypothetical protein
MVLFGKAFKTLGREIKIFFCFAMLKSTNLLGKKNNEWPKKRP